MGYYAYKLDEATREGLLATFAPAYPNVEVDHILYKYGADGESMPHPERMEIIGMHDNGNGLQAALVRINGSVERPDGNLYHIIWSRASKNHDEIDHKEVARFLKEQGVYA